MVTIARGEGMRICLASATSCFPTAPLLCVKLLDEPHPQPPLSLTSLHFPTAARRDLHPLTRTHVWHRCVCCVSPLHPLAGVRAGLRSLGPFASSAQVKK